MASYITLTKEGQTELLDRVDAPSPYKVANCKTPEEGERLRRGQTRRSIRNRNLARVIGMEARVIGVRASDGLHLIKFDGVSEHYGVPLSSVATKREAFV